MATEEVSDDNNGTYWRALKVIKNGCCTSEARSDRCITLNWITDTRTCTISAGRGVGSLPCSRSAIGREVLDLLTNSIVVKDGDNGYRAILDAVSVSSSVFIQKQSLHLSAKYLVLSIVSASPRSYFFEVCAYFQRSARKVAAFCLPEGRADCYQYCQRERRSVKVFEVPR